MDYLRMDALTLRAEVVEVKDKPTYPIGEFAIDAFGRKPVYEDRGIRRRAILALGRADVGELESLIPREPGLTVIGGSSDHCIVDVEDCPRRLQVGDIVEFSLCYSHMLYATARSDMRIIFKTSLHRRSKGENGRFRYFDHRRSRYVFAFFVVAPMMLQAASLFGVQKQFAKAMVQEGVVTQEAVDRIHPKSRSPVW